MSGAFLEAERPRVTMVVKLTEAECDRFTRLLARATADGDLELLPKRILDCLDFVLPLENVRARVAGHLFAVYLDRNFDGQRFDELAPPPRSDA